MLLRDASPGSDGSDPRNLTAVGDRLFFTASDPEHGDELWVSDGSASGTVVVADIVPGTGGSDPSELTTVGDRLFFSAQDNAHGREVWVLSLSGVLPLFVRGDANTDGALSVSDPVATLAVLFASLEAPDCLDALDSDDNGKVDLTDAVYELEYLFLGGPEPPGPFPDCGYDPSPDDLSCEAPPRC
jgi:ELWxxDGT repeat protein